MKNNQIRNMDDDIRITHDLANKIYQKLVLYEILKDRNKSIEYYFGYQDGMIDCFSTMMNNESNGRKQNFSDENTWVHVVQEIIHNLNHLRGHVEAEEFDMSTLDREITIAIAQYPNRIKMVDALMNA